MKIAMALLRHLHAWGTTYQEPAMPSTEQSALQQPDPPSSAQSVLLLLSCLTKRHSVALKVRTCSELLRCRCSPALPSCAFAFHVIAGVLSIL